jgi:hypothetical protein
MLLDHIEEVVQKFGHLREGMEFVDELEEMSA